MFKLSEYTVIDVETANSSRASLCSIGIVKVKDDRIVYSNEYLVNPETHFDQMNISIHGITSEMVRSKPSFPEIWNDIADCFLKGVVVAHNAAFDLSVIWKSMERYDIPTFDFSYICTYKKAKSHFSKDKFGNYKLDTLCNGFNIPLKTHHAALCDAIACQDLLIRLKDEYGLNENDVSTYRSAPINNSRLSQKSIVHKAMNTLYGILLGIGYDDNISIEECVAIRDWMKKYNDYRNSNSLEECYSLLESILEDGLISRDEYQKTVESFKHCGESSIFSESSLAMQTLQGIIEGISSDEIIEDVEAQSLLNWMQEHMFLKGSFPFDNIFASLEAALKDGVISDVEQKELNIIFSEFVNPKQETNMTIDLNGKQCCLTGNFSHGTKENVENFIISFGGIISKTVTNSTNILIVGGQGSADWKFGNYGSKVSKALQLKEKGKSIVIISEENLFNEECNNGS